MDVPKPPERIEILLIGILVLLSPALILLITIEFLVFTGDLILSDVTLLELLELYIIDLMILAGVAYGLYRLVKALVIHRLPESLDTVEEEETRGSTVERRGEE